MCFQSVNNEFDAAASRFQLATKSLPHLSKNLKTIRRIPLLSTMVKYQMILYSSQCSMASQENWMAEF